MNRFSKKIIAKTFTAFIILMNFAPLAAAQTDVSDPLGAIKSKLEREGIEVVDYSAPNEEKPWGSISSDVAEVLGSSDSKFTDLEDFENRGAYEIKTDIRILFGDYLIKTITENQVKTLLRNELRRNPSSDEVKNKVQELRNNELDKIANLIYQEAKFRANYKKWASLPKVIFGILADDYNSLNELKIVIEKYIEENGGTPEEFMELFYGDLLTGSQRNAVITEILRSGSQINIILLSVTKVIRNLLGGLAIIWIIISGIQLIMSGSDEAKVTEQKRSITYAVIGLGIVLLLERLVVLVFGIPGVERGLSTAGPGISSEIFGLITFIKALIGSIAILMIIISGFKTIAAQGEEEKITNQRKSILWIIVGIVVILINKVIIDNLYIQPVDAGDQITKTNVQNIIELLGTVTQFLLGFVGLIALGALIYGAGTMITNYGNDEMVEKSKKIVKNAIIGIIVIISAFTIISTVIL